MTKNNTAKKTASKTTTRMKRDPQMTMSQKKPKTRAKKTAAPKPASPWSLTIPFLIAARTVGSIREYVDLEEVKHTIKGKEVVIVDLAELPITFAQTLPRYMPGSPQAALAERFTDQPVDTIFDTLVSSINEFGRSMQILGGKADPLVEMELNGFWYPIPINVSYQTGYFGGPFVSVAVDLAAVDFIIRKRWFIDEMTFKNPAGDRIKRTVIEILSELGLRRTTPEKVAVMRDMVFKAATVGAEYGKVVDVPTSVLVAMTVGWREVLLPMRFGSEQSPKSIITENELEVDRDMEEKHAYNLPLVRGFSPDLKRFGYVDVRSLKPHVFDKTAKDRIVLPADERHVLDAVFSTPPNLIFGDLFKNRHGGIVILAAGPPGTGKTLTAEVYSEFTGRPLYALEMGELGTSLEHVENNLQRIFDRARRWNAVLLFDEVDVFLAERGEDIEKAAIVGVFLRLLDQYEGTFFLTTNRPEVIDKAFKSRITVKIEYPALNDEKRTRVWELLLEAAGFKLNGEMDWLAAHDLNGRNARNATRILRILHPDATSLTRENLEEALKYIAR